MEVRSKITRDDQMVGLILAEKYEIESVILKDEIGTLYLGNHLLMEKPVTIRTLSSALAVDQQIVERFCFEAKTISRLSHPNILNVTDFGKDIDGTVYTVLEYVEGEVLKDFVFREGALPVDRAVRIARQIAAALSAAHSGGVVHTSLSSNNILVYDSGNGNDSVKIFDIGSFSSGFKAANESGPSIADVEYLSPEQCSQQTDPDERSDIYSLGVIFYELLTGEVPFTADTISDLMIKHLEVPPPPLAAFRSDLPDEIEPILLNALAKNPDRRFQTAAAFAEDLGEALSDKGEDDTIVIQQATAAVTSGTNIWKTAFIVLAGISLLAIGLIYWTRPKTIEPLTALPTDSDSQPVQPLNPATGINEQGNLMMLPPGTLVQGDPSLTGPAVGGGGDGYDPWANVPVPPSGGGQGNVPVGPGGEIYTIPGDGSIFMPDPDGGGVILVPKIIPEESPSPSPSASPAPTKTPAKNSPSPVPEGTKKQVVGPTPGGAPPKEVNDAQKNNKKPAKPAPSPSAGNNAIRSGVEQDT